MKRLLGRTWLSRSASCCALAMVLSVFGGGSAHAATITVFTDQTLWLAAVGGAPVVTEDFADATLATGLSLATGTGGISGGAYTDTAVCGICYPTFNTPIFSFSPGTLAFAADWDLSPGGKGSGLTFTINGSDTVNLSNPAAADATFAGFFGFVSDTAMTSIVLTSGFTGNGETFTADNVKFVGTGGTGTGGDTGGGGTGTTVPEPSMFAQLGVSAMAFVGMAARRRKQQ